MSEKMEAIAKKSITGKKSTNNTTSTGDKAMSKTKVKPGKRTAKKAVRQATKKKVAVVEVPEYVFTPYELPATITGLKSRLGQTQSPVREDSMEASMQKMIADGYPTDLMFRIFRLQTKWADRDDAWISARVNKYRTQELNLMNAGHIIDMLHPVYQLTITRRKAAKKAAATRKAKASNKKS